jgi:hypothetical protein
LNDEGRELRFDFQYGNQGAERCEVEVVVKGVHAKARVCLAQIGECVAGTVAALALARNVRVEVEGDGRLHAAGLRQALGQEIVANLEEGVALLQAEYVRVVRARMFFRVRELVAYAAYFLREGRAGGNVFARRFF